MATQSLDKEISAHLALLNDKQKKTVLTVVKDLAAAKQDWWDEIGTAQQQAIDKALGEMKSGKLTPHDTVMKKYKKWLA
jgi:predicted transcriptional regulator